MQEPRWRMGQTGWRRNHTTRRPVLLPAVTLNTLIATHPSIRRPARRPDMEVIWPAWDEKNERWEMRYSWERSVNVYDVAARIYVWPTGKTVVRLFYRDGTPVSQLFIYVPQPSPAWTDLWETQAKRRLNAEAEARVEAAFRHIAEHWLDPLVVHLQAAPDGPDARV